MNRKSRGFQLEVLGIQFAKKFTWASSTSTCGIRKKKQFLLPLLKMHWLRLTFTLKTNYDLKIDVVEGRQRCGCWNGRSDRLLQLEESGINAEQGGDGGFTQCSRQWSSRAGSLTTWRHHRTCGCTCWWCRFPISNNSKIYNLLNIANKQQNVFFPPSLWQNLPKCLPLSWNTKLLRSTSSLHRKATNISIN